MLLCFAFMCFLSCFQSGVPTHTLNNTGPDSRNTHTHSESKAAHEPWTAILTTPHRHIHHFLNWMTFIGAIQTVCCLSPSLSLSHIHSGCVCVCVTCTVHGVCICVRHKEKDREMKGEDCAFWLELKAFYLMTYNKLNHKPSEPFPPHTASHIIFQLIYLYIFLIFAQHWNVKVLDSNYQVEENRSSHSNRTGKGRICRICGRIRGGKIYSSNVFKYMSGVLIL